MGIRELFTVRYWVEIYLTIKNFLYLFFYSIFYPPPKQRRDVGANWGGTSYHNYGDSGSGDGGGGSSGNNNQRPPRYRGADQGDNRGSVNRFRACARIPGRGG